MTTIKEHKTRYDKLITLYEKLNVALLGETTEMKYEYERLRKKVIEEAREEWAIITELQLQDKMEMVNG